jgi:hypothetical protein
MSELFEGSWYCIPYMFEWAFLWSCDIHRWGHGMRRRCILIQAWIVDSWVGDCGQVQMSDFFASLFGAKRKDPHCSYQSPIVLMGLQTFKLICKTQTNVFSCDGLFKNYYSANSFLWPRCIPVIRIRPDPYLIGLLDPNPNYKEDWKKF